MPFIVMAAVFSFIMGSVYFLSVFITMDPAWLFSEDAKSFRAAWSLIAFLFAGVLALDAAENKE